MPEPRAEESVKGERRFQVWYGGLSGRIWAGWMTYDGTRWVSKGEKHDVTGWALLAVEQRQADQ